LRAPNALRILSPSLGHGYKHHVHHDNAGNDQGDESDWNNRHGDNADDPAKKS
jgi:hypothetical protein